MSTAVRIEHDRPSDQPLVELCQRGGASHINPIGNGWYAVDLPADVYRLIWIGPEHTAVRPQTETRTYRNRLDRGEDLVALFAQYAGDDDEDPT